MLTYWWSADEQYRYWRFLIDNVQDPSGFTYFGVPYLGEYLQPTPGVSARLTENYVELSEIGFADQGAPFQNEKDRGKKYSLLWTGLTNNEKLKLGKAADYLKLGRPFFFALDPQNDTDGVIYVLSYKAWAFQHVAPSYWQVTMGIEEALG